LHCAWIDAEYSGANSHGKFGAQSLHGERYRQASQTAGKVDAKYKIEAAPLCFSRDDDRINLDPG
jgi:hypothetical protein